MQVAFVLGVAVVGLFAGSYATMLIHRSPVDLPLVGRPVCPHCDERLSGRDLVPVVSWLALGRRCRTCDHPLSLRYPVVEVVTAVLMAGLAVSFGATWEAFPLLLSVPVLVAASAVDLETYRLPDRLVWPAVAIGAAVVVATALAMGDPGRIASAGVGSVIFSTMLFIPHLIMPAGMGFGDVKFALFLGMMLGWLHVGLPLPALVMATLLAAVIGVALQLFGVLAGSPDEQGEKRRLTRTRIPFGPFLAAGTYLAYLLHDVVIDAWLG